MSSPVSNNTPVGDSIGASSSITSDLKDIVIKIVAEKAIEYAVNEIQSDDPFGLRTGGNVGRAYKYVKAEVKSDDPFGLYTGGKTARVIKGEEECITQ